MPGLRKKSTGLAFAPMLKLVAGTKFDGYFAFPVIIGWKMLPLNLYRLLKELLDDHPTSTPRLRYKEGEENAARV